MKQIKILIVVLLIAPIPVAAQTSEPQDDDILGYQKLCGTSDVPEDWSHICEFYQRVEDEIIVEPEVIKAVYDLLDAGHDNRILINRMGTVTEKLDDLAGRCVHREYSQLGSTCHDEIEIQRKEMVDLRSKMILAELKYLRALTLLMTVEIQVVEGLLVGMENGAEKRPTNLHSLIFDESDVLAVQEVETAYTQMIVTFDAIINGVADGRVVTINDP